MSKSNKEKVLNALANKKLVKVIAGINNYNKQKVLDVVTSAEFGGANSVDICDDAEIIKAVRGTIELAIFVSSVNAKKLIEAQQYGADVLEIGNFESLYKEGKSISKEEILNIAKEVKLNLKENVLLCCTVPATLDVKDQLELAGELLNLGVDILQTEGFAPELPVTERKDQTYTEILRAASTLTNTKEITKAFPDANVISASGITPTTAPLAISMGASGIGVGNFISSQPYQAYMTDKVKILVDSLYDFSSAYLRVKEQLLAYS